MAEQIQRVKVWGGWLRFSHMALGLSTLLLLTTGWLLGVAPAERLLWVDLHYIAASVLIFSVSLRVLLMFTGQPVARLSVLMPDDNEWRSVLDTLKFYITLGKAPLPRWYAHNPLWKPIYLLSYFILLSLIVTGAFQTEYPFVNGYYLPLLHVKFASPMLFFVVLHLIAVVFHDYRGNAADVSSIINGHRHYLIEKLDFADSTQETAVHIDQIDGPKASGKQE